MGIGGQAGDGAAVAIALPVTRVLLDRDSFAPVALQPRLAQTPFEVGPGIHTRRGVRLEVDQVTALLAVIGLEAMIETGLEQIGGRGIGGDMATEFAGEVVGPHHHCQGIPAHDGRHPLLQQQVAGKGRLAFERDAVAIGRVHQWRQLDAPVARMVEQLAQHEAGALGALLAHQVIQRRQPLGGFGRIDILRDDTPVGGGIG